MGSTDLVVISIVTFGNDLRFLPTTLASLARAASQVGQERGTLHLVIVDNGPCSAERSATLGRLLSDWQGPSGLISGHGNIGYGRGHNLAIAGSKGRYHLVLNPDVELSPEALAAALAFLDEHPDCGLLAPAVYGPDGALQYLCKRRPTILDLALRGVAPPWLRGRLQTRLAYYEMQDLINDRDILWDPPVVSGCFMLFRTPVLERLAGFDPRYFLYFEDFDLSMRALQVARVAYVPRVRIVHHGGAAARKGLRHVLMFMTSAVRFFQRHGWRWS